MVGVYLGYFKSNSVSFTRRLLIRNSNTNMNNKQIIHGFLFNIRNYSPELSKTQLAPLQLHLEKFDNFGGLYVTQSNICHGTFIAKIVSRSVYSQKSSIVDARLSSKYISAFRKDSSNVLFLESLRKISFNVVSDFFSK